MHTAKAAQTFKIHFIDVGCADAALLQYGEGTEAKYALIDTGANQYHNTKDTTIDTTKTPVYEYLNKMGVKHLEFVVLTHPHGDHIGGMKKILEDKNITIDTIYGNPLEFEYLESSEDKEKQTEETARWTAFDTQTYQTFKKKLEKRNSYKDASLHIQYVVPQAGTSVKLGEAVMTFYGPLDNTYRYGRAQDAPNLNTRQVNNCLLYTSDAADE
mgnify:FL=1